MLGRSKWTNDFFSNTSEEVQRSVHSLTTMVHSLLESTEDVSSRLANLEERLARTVIPEAGNAESQSVFESLSLTSKPSALNTYQYSDIRGQESSTAASQADSTIDSKLDPHVQRILQESRVYSRNLHRNSVSTMPWSYRSTGGWSMLSGISLAQISNISVLSIPITASEVWGAGHYVNQSVSQAFSNDRTLVKKKLRSLKMPENSPRPSVGISQAFRRLIPPFVLGSDEARRNAEINHFIQRELSKPKEHKMLLLGKPIDRMA